MEKKLCKDCDYFEILYEPYRPGGVLLDWGKAHCKKHDMVLDFANHRKINRIECIETELSEVE